MKKVRKNLIVMIVALVVLTISNVSYAKDFSNMTVDEITEWVMENQPEQIFKGIYEDEIGVRSGDSGKILTQKHTVVVSNYWRVLGHFEGQAWWIADMNQNVTSFGPNVYRALPAAPDVIAYAEYSGGYLVTPSNARVTLQGYFVDWTDRYDVIQVYNLYGNGTYSYWEYKD